MQCAKNTKIRLHFVLYKQECLFGYSDPQVSAQWIFEQEGQN